MEQRRSTYAYDDGSDDDSSWASGSGDDDDHHGGFYHTSATTRDHEDRLTITPDSIQDPASRVGWTPDSMASTGLDDGDDEVLHSRRGKRDNDDGEEQQTNYDIITTSTTNGGNSDGRFSWGEVGALGAMHRQNAQILEELGAEKKKNRQLKVIIEAMEPLPGLDAGRFLDAMKEKGENIDYRDGKIIHLAKKCRSLRLTLEQYKAKHSRAWKELQELKCGTSPSTTTTTTTTKGSSSSSSSSSCRGGGRDGSKTGSDGDDGGKTTTTTITRRNQHQYQHDGAMIASIHKQVGDLRVKLEQAHHEIRRLTKIVAKEVGEGPVLDKAMKDDEGSSWKGRAQQIIKLKARVKGLEDALKEATSTTTSNSGSGSGSGITTAFPAGTTTTDLTTTTGGGGPFDHHHHHHHHLILPLPASSPSSSALSPYYPETTTPPAAAAPPLRTGAMIDVDRKAIASLQHLEREKTRGAHEAQLQCMGLRQEVIRLKKKVEANKARSQYLEEDVGKYKDQVRFLLKKAANDDELIKVLRAESSALMREKRTWQKEYTYGSGTTTTTTTSGGGGGSKMGSRQVRIKPGEHKSEERKELEKSVGTDTMDIMLAARAENVRPEEIIRRLRMKMKSAVVVAAPVPSSTTNQT